MGITGVKSIELLDGDGILKVDHQNYVATVKADTAVRLQISTYYPQTPDFKKGQEQWIFQPLETTAISYEKAQAIQAKRGRKIELTLPKKLCGRALCWVEAFSFVPENKPPTGWFIVGQCEPAITDVQWHKPAPDNTGAVIPTGRPEVKYGDTVQLHIDTEGLNGEVLEVQIWDDALLDDKLYSFKQRVVHGKLIQDVVIPQAWRAKAINYVGQLAGVEAKLYARIAHPTLHNEGKNYAENLVVKNEYTDNAASKSGNVRVAVDYVPVRPSRYQHCKYEGIVVESGDRKVTLFTQEEAQNPLPPLEVVAGTNKGKKEVTVTLKEYETAECWRVDEDSHKDNKTNIIFIEDGQQSSSTEQSLMSGDLNFNVKSPLRKVRLFPLEYIWLPAIGPNKYTAALNTCRYSRDLVILVYPDIQWEFNFCIDLEDSIAYKYQNLNKYDLKKARKTSKNIAKSRRYNKKDYTFGFELKADWDNNSRSDEFSAKWSNEIQQLGKTIAAIDNSLDTILGETKGSVRKMDPLKGLPIEFEFKPPAIRIGAKWKLAEMENNYGMGTELEFFFKAAPLLELEMTIDLLGAAVGSVGNYAAIKIYDKIKEFASKDRDRGASGDVYIDLIITGTIEGSLDATLSPNNEKDKIEGKLESIITAELKAGAYVKAKFSIVIAEAYGELGLDISGKAGLRFGHQLTHDESGLYYRPMLKFDGLRVVVIITGDVGLSSKEEEEEKNHISKQEDPKFSEAKDGMELYKGEWDVLKPFDVIKKLESSLDVNSNVILIENK